MKLTGKIKEDFEKWFEKNDYDEKLDFGKHWIPFDEYPFEMQIGVLKLFFDSVGVELIITKYIGQNMFIVQYIFENKKWTLLGIKNKHFTRQEAWESAILKANTILNEM